MDPECLPIQSDSSRRAACLISLVGSPAKSFPMSTGRLLVGRDAPALVGQIVRIPRFIFFLGGQSGRPDLGLCLILPVDPIFYIP